MRYVQERLAQIGAQPQKPAKERPSRIYDAEIGPVTVARFWSKVNVRKSTEDCWEWLGAFNGSGYGNFRVPEFGRSSHSAHRVSFRLAKGRFPPEGLVVRHRCDNPKCVNPHHLEEGTKSDNAMDMVKRGRFPYRNQKGESNGAAKLDRVKVEEIRRRSAMGETNVSIAASFGVSHQMVSKIKKGHFWK